MRINYNILWFENDRTSYETKKESVKEILEEFCFNFPEPRYEADGNHIDDIDFSKYDLIIADMNLDSNQKAMKLLDKIRQKDIFTEVLFYSSSGEDEVRMELSKYKIDGAYCSGRESTDFNDKVKAVIETLIKKTQNLTTLRGLVMAEVSELDLKMKKIIETFCVKCPSKEKDLINYIVNKIEKRTKDALIANTELECKKNCSHIWKNKNKISEIIEDQSFDSYAKARLIDYIMKQNNKNAQFLENYNKRVIENRNQLAHCISENIDGKEVLKTAKGDKEFTEEDFKIIRKDILEYEKMFDSMLNETTINTGNQSIL